MKDQWGGGILDRKNPKGLQRFTKNKKQKRIVIGSIVGILLLIGGISLYRSFAMYKVEKTFNVLQGTVPDFSTSDIKLAITLDGKEVEEVKKEEGKNYKVDVQCDKGAKGSWNYSKWQVEVKDFKKGTKCDVSFTTSTEEIPTIPSSDDAIVLSLSDVIHVSTANTFGEFDISQYSHLYIYLYGQTEANLNAMCFSLDNAQIACIGDIPGTSSYRILDITKNKLLKIYNTSLNGAGVPRGNIGWLVVVD